MIIVRGNHLAGLGATGLGATGSGLDTQFTIPVIGVRISIRQILIMMCNAADLDPTLCKLITSKPAEACKTLVGMGNTWLTNKVKAAVSKLMSNVLDSVDCKKKNWKQILGNSIQVSFSQKGGVNVEIDLASIAQDVLCNLANRALTAVLTPAINSIVRKLNEACEKLGGSSPAGSSTSTAYTSVSTTPSSGGTSAFDAINKVKATVAQTAANVATAQKSPGGGGGSVYSVQTTPKTDSAVLVWGGVGVTLAGVAWFTLSRR